MNETSLLQVKLNEVDSSKKATPVIWLYGRPSAGKTTLANELKAQLDQCGVASCILDGDVLRNAISKDLGFSLEDRAENLRRAAEIAKIIASSGIVVIAAFVTPLLSHRELINSILKKSVVQFVYLECSHEECVKRDAKGLYEKAKSGGVAEMTGVTSPFEIPAIGQNDLVLSSINYSPEQLAKTVRQAIPELRFIP